MNEKAVADIVVVTDKNMVEPTIVLACSIFRRVQGIVHLHVVCDNLQEKVSARIASILNQERGPHQVSLLSVDSQAICIGLEQKIHLTKAAYLRLFFDILFPQLKRLIYMDTDMLVIRGFDVEKILESVDNHCIAAVEEPGLARIYSQIHPDTSFYNRSFNTGFLVMNLEKLRENNMLKKIIIWLKKHMDSVLYADQDGFNALLAGDCSGLDSKFNTTRGSTAESVIIHYPDFRKPWSEKGAAISTRSNITSLIYLLFRQKTSMRKNKREIIGLMIHQLYYQIMQICTHRIPFLNLYYDLRQGKIGPSNDMEDSSMAG